MKSFFFMAFCVGFFGFLQGKELLDIRIPVVDMSDYYDEDHREEFLETLYKAMTQVGFFAVRNTGVNVHIVHDAYAQAEAFFKQDLKEKIQYFSPNLNGQRGFVPGEVAKGNLQKDRKEFYHIGRESALPENIWPKEPLFNCAMSSLYKELEQYVIPLQETIIAAINLYAHEKLNLNLLNSMTEQGDSLLRALYYPAISDEEISLRDTPLYWAASHTDIDFLAILPYATAKGLQVELEGRWLNVIVPEDAFIVNIGDMLENLTNGLLVSARHRVLAQEPNQDRFSMVLFVHPVDESALDPLPACVELTGGIQTYAAGTRQEFLWERLLELNIAPALLEPYSRTGHAERQMEYGRESLQVIKLLLDNGLASPELLKKMEKRGPF
jgi:isopenicillin N synthase-like dioxygenase